MQKIRYSWLRIAALTLMLFSNLFLTTRDKLIQLMHYAKIF
ncbi:hypothetical protein [Cellvibrio mixtus]|nr:hypothetical protein [Cellvibrio mixtus]